MKYLYLRFSRKLPYYLSYTCVKNDKIYMIIRAPYIMHIVCCGIGLLIYKMSDEYDE